ncbi:PKD-like family lipoprotein [Pedobacter insulae]|uniref:PKD-like family protein n=1 Tax=Pedobacter insulae TaxID=414048 RepID=A0A1I2VUP1_9SPHI|nr:PKD-like family lipoprotein [Pedobacter insulae]SFG92077.1 PKD-like family protein [Pedobacter insulae]
MNLKIYTPVVIALLATLLMGACKKDIGNYSYKEINELSEITNLPSEVTATYGKNLTLTPITKFSKDPNFDESKYTYEWYYIGPNGLGGTKLFNLATTRNLDLKVGLVAGTYPAYYAVIEKQTGIRYRTSFTLKVVNEINEGWILMTDVNNKARVDMLSLNSEGNFNVINDLLATTGSELQLEGKPVMTYTYSTGLLIGPDAINFGVYFSTDKGTTKVDPNTFKWTNTMRLNYEMFGDIPTGFYADVIQQKGSGSAHMIGHGNAYYYERTQNIYFSAPISYIAEEQKGFEVAPFIASDATTFVGNTIFYDKTNKRFVKHSANASTCTTLPEPTADQKKFSFSTGMDLLFMTWAPFNGGEVFSILKDPNTTKKYLARFNSSSNIQTYYDEIIGTDIANAEFFAVSPDLGYIFYNVGSKVYEYDMVYKTSKLMLNLESKKISYFKFHPFKRPSKYLGSNKLMIGTYDPALPSGSDGSLSIYTVPPVNGNLVLDENYSGFGKIKDLTYRER